MRRRGRASASNGVTNNDVAMATESGLIRFGSFARSSCIPRIRIIVGNAAPLSNVIGRVAIIGSSMAAAFTRSACFRGEVAACTCDVRSDEHQHIRSQRAVVLTSRT